MSYETLETALVEGILTITINRPSQMNALNQVALDELHEVIDEAEKSDEIKCLIIAGSEKFFCTGADITEVNKVNSSFSGYAFSRKYQECFGRLEKLSKPVVSAVRGYALGAGCELLIASDFRIAAENAKIGLSEVNIGAIPAGGGSAKLPRIINPLKAKEIICFGKPISGKEAAEIGLVNKAVPAEQVLTEANAWAKELAQKPPLVLKTIKEIINLAYKDIDALLHYEAQGLGMLADTEDFKEGTGAFLEKRKPVFRGK
ncbi:MAG: enoyl-CoA hydratase/isomerase family protein [Clostridia bacterium]|nr:enoyl-CoA hydratase/isomerase family protein [Clostridia bacterium]